MRTLHCSLKDLPWFGYNYLLYHNPVYGFELSNLVFSGQHVFNLSSIAAALNSLLQILWPIFIVIGILIYLRKIRGYNFHNLFKSISRDEIYLLIFAIFEFIYIGSAQNYITWLLYPLYIALIIIGIKILSRIELPSIHAIKINITLALIVFLILSILIYYNLNPNNKISNWHLWFSKNPNYSAAINKSKDLGCNALYSNAWPYLMIYNPTVNSFYLSSTKNSIATDSCILFFNTSNVGVPVNLSKFNFTILNKNLNYSIFKNN